MNYSKNIRKSVIAKRVITSWVIVALLFYMFGCVSGYAVKTHMTTKGNLKMVEQTS